jgi:hypothetical protein
LLNQLLTMIRDPELDPHNRLLMVYLYRIYCLYQPEALRAAKLEPLRAALQALQAWMRGKVVVSG